MSRHLRTLRKSGLIEEERDGFDSRVRIYRLKPDAIATLKGWLAETDTLWARQLVSLKAHLRKNQK